MHDWYLALLASAFGKLVYIDKPAELYRQHSSNVLGARTLRRVKTGFGPMCFLISIGNLSRLVKSKQNLLDLSLSPENKRWWLCDYHGRDVETLSTYTQHGYRKNRAFRTCVFVLDIDRICI